VVQENGEIRHHRFHELPDLLRIGDILSFNNSKVIAARLNGYRPARDPQGPVVAVEVTLHKRLAAERFRAFAQPARRLRPEDLLVFAQGLEARVLDRQGGEITLAFNRKDVALDHAIAAVGAMPLPPYIAKQRSPDAQDFSDYQTVYAREEGSVAAPTAGLHFTNELLERLAAKGLARADLTLHVGAGTFLPVSAADTDQHVMHSERGVVSHKAATRLNAARAAGGRIVAVGTTSLRTLETASDAEGRVRPYAGDTDIFITPGYRFKAVDVLVTNFHLPRSTLFMLVCAFMGTEIMQRAYREAIAKGYRFYSYGDACLLLRPR
jgi:S-adenosylmethionine:tRNA ribosyltransferase-isomerase